MSKKLKIALGVLALIVVFCLWYTRPRSFDDLTGTGEVKNYSMIVSVTSTEDGKAISENWIVNGRTDRDNTGAALKEVLNGCKYRVSLRSLLPFPSHDTIRGEGNIIASCSMVLNDGSDFMGTFRGQTAAIRSDRTILLKAEDKEISKKLFEFAKTYGELSSSSVKE